ncbi:PQQ-like beta-propeller repeat protein [Sphingomonas nostoxanthinifaciens]|uniref:PQQ-like beta-propeller repeat protein n=1 Tax=Sphingomonas nostoxanthinifaciens TaxID=2872652 RepID=UPI001CC1D386|nr:PQQ-like beta-propeller repeat protein [Sphingomonas nostoxanthinifaciens]UAK25381.1 PQQ-like beta-propeller repeat protein [Sphingomonas nostoxanthinifaciens]
MKMTKRVVVALAMVAALSGCGIFRSKGEHRPKTAVVGERIPVLTSEGDAAVEPSLADVAVTVPDAAPNDTWSQTGGNSTKVMGNPALGATIKPAWDVKIPAGGPRERLAAGPVVADGKLYVVDAEAVVRAFDAATGRKLWEVAPDATKREKPVLFGGGVSVDNGRVFATNGRGDVIALDAATGKQIWKARPSGPLRGAPGFGNGNIFVLTQDNQIIALSEEKGEVVWTVSATLQTAGVFGVAAPSYAQGTVVAGFSSGELSALRYENGRIVWQDQLSRTSISTSVSTISDVDAAPVLDQGKVYAIGQGGRMVAMDLVSGQRLWEITIGGIDTPWLAGEWLFVVTDDARLLCIARTTGKIRWITQLTHFRDPKTKNKAVGWSGPILAGGRLVLVNTLGEMVQVKVADGKVMSTQRKAGKGFYLSPIVANNTLYTLDQKGKLTAWR